ncbi:MAG: nitroreductase [Rhodothermales bacterium]
MTPFTRQSRSGTSPLPDAAATAALIRARRTIHLFEPDLPPREAVFEAIDLARWAPNHRLTEPWRFYVLGRETAEAVARLNAGDVAEQRGPEAAQKKLERWLAMPGWLVVTAAASDDPLITQENYAACCCAIQNMQLYLWSKGIGMKWGTGKVTRDSRFFDLLGIDPAREHLVGMFWYGYPAEVPVTQRKPVEEIVTELP